MAEVPTEVRIEEALARVEADVAAERARLAALMDKLGDRGLGNRRAAEMKPLWNLLERRYLLRLMKTRPDLTYMSQVRITGVRKPDGSILELGSIRIADWGVMNADGAIQLGEIKSRSAIVKSVKGGLSDPAVQAAYREGAAAAIEFAKEATALDIARRVNGKLILSCEDPISAARHEKEFTPAKVSQSRLTDYEAFPDAIPALEAASEQETERARTKPEAKRSAQPAAEKTAPEPKRKAVQPGSKPQGAAEAAAGRSTEPENRGFERKTKEQQPPPETEAAKAARSPRGGAGEPPKPPPKQASLLQKMMPRGIHVEALGGLIEMLYAWQQSSLWKDVLEAVQAELQSRWEEIHVPRLRGYWVVVWVDVWEPASKDLLGMDPHPPLFSGVTITNGPTEHDALNSPGVVAAPREQKPAREPRRPVPKGYELTGYPVVLEPLETLKVPNGETTWAAFSGVYRCTLTGACAPDTDYIFDIESRTLVLQFQTKPDLKASVSIDSTAGRGLYYTVLSHRLDEKRGILHVECKDSLGFQISSDLDFTTFRDYRIQENFRATSAGRLYEGSAFWTPRPGMRPVR